MPVLCFSRVALKYCGEGLFHVSWLVSLCSKCSGTCDKSSADRMHACVQVCQVAEGLLHADCFHMAYETSSHWELESRLLPHQEVRKQQDVENAAPNPPPTVATTDGKQHADAAVPSKDQVRGCSVGFSQ